MWILQTPRDADRPLTLKLTRGDAKTLGRAPGADVVVEAPLVSRLHCRLSANPAGLEVVDLDSTNGTFVNDRRVKRAVLAPGDRVRVGRVTLVVSVSGDRG
jgi:pSer/pThr/pTyr-binding forkhead associated (FHA) protein